VRFYFITGRVDGPSAGAASPTGPPDEKDFYVDGLSPSLGYAHLSLGGERAGLLRAVEGPATLGHVPSPWASRPL